MKIASGIFTWDGDERRSKRYGEFVCSDADYNNTTTMKTSHTVPKELVGKRVKLTAHVLETRKSGHVGDLFINIFPTTPEVGEKIEIGVGILGVGNPFGEPSIILAPSTPRQYFWVDPRILYRLHDQSVELHAELTDEPDSIFDFPTIEEPGVKSLGNEKEGIYLQASEVMPTKVYPTAKKLGKGLFSFNIPDEFGERVKFEE